MKGTVDDIKTVLSRVPLFANLPAEELARLTEIGQYISIGEGQTVFLEDDPGDTAYIILEGRVNILRAGTVDGADVVLASLQPGEVFGELALIDGKPRSASAVALENCEFLIIDRDNFIQMLSRTPRVLGDFMKHQLTRLRDTNAAFFEATEAEGLLETKSAELYEVKQQAVRDRTQLLNAINSVREGFLLVSEERIVGLVNKSMEEMFHPCENQIAEGVGSGECFAWISQMLFPNDANRAAEWLAHQTAKFDLALAGDGNVEPDEVTGPGDRTFWIRHRPMMQGGVVTTITDTTERSRMEARLRQSQRLEALGTLAGGVAHEINTPVQYVADNISFLMEAFDSFVDVSNRSQAIVEGEADPKSLKELRSLLEDDDIEFYRQEAPTALSQSRDGIQQIAKIVQAVKEFSHPGTKEHTDVDIDHLVHNAATVTRNKWKYVAELDVRVEQKNLVVSGHADELSQVLFNLIVNAADAVADVHGESGEGKIEIIADTVPSGVEILVTDNGTGMDDVTRSKIFDQFFTTKPPGKGTGQGLSISHRIVTEKHGGELSCTSSPGHGTTFKLKLPVQT
ncbi:MAG: hypothetical protein CMM47_01920 [Rhodospirillaceae bacterium]|nr:hypothetical protein [Rhodospirillaceae bacterium]